MLLLHAPSREKGTSDAHLFCDWEVEILSCYFYSKSDVGEEKDTVFIGL